MGIFSSDNQALCNSKGPTEEHNPFQNDYRMRQGSQKQSHSLPERLVLYFLLLILDSVSRNCE